MSTRSRSSDKSRKDSACKKARINRSTICIDIFDYVEIKYVCEFYREKLDPLKHRKMRLKDDSSLNRSYKNYGKFNIVSIERLG